MEIYNEPVPSLLFFWYDTRGLLPSTTMIHFKSTSTDPTTRRPRSQCIPWNMSCDRYDWEQSTISHLHHKPIYMFQSKPAKKSNKQEERNERTLIPNYLLLITPPCRCSKTTTILVQKGTLRKEK